LGFGNQYQLRMNVLCSALTYGLESQQRVRPGSSGMSALSLLFPNKQTLIAAAGRSVRCHNQS